MSKKKIALKFLGSSGLVSEVEFQITDGVGTYEKWRRIPGNGFKTEKEYVRTLRAKNDVTTDTHNIVTSLVEYPGPLTNTDQVVIKDSDGNPAKPLTPNEDTTVVITYPNGSLDGDDTIGGIIINKDTGETVLEIPKQPAGESGTEITIPGFPNAGGDFELVIVVNDKPINPPLVLDTLPELRFSSLSIRPNEVEFEESFELKGYLATQRNVPAIDGTEVNIKVTDSENKEHLFKSSTQSGWFSLEEINNSGIGKVSIVCSVTSLLSEEETIESDIINANFKPKPPDAKFVFTQPKSFMPTLTMDDTTLISSVISPVEGVTEPFPPLLLFVDGVETKLSASVVNSKGEIEFPYRNSQREEGTEKITIGYRVGQWVYKSPELLLLFEPPLPYTPNPNEIHLDSFEELKEVYRVGESIKGVAKFANKYSTAVNERVVLRLVGPDGVVFGEVRRVTLTGGRVEFDFGQKDLQGNPFRFTEYRIMGGYEYGRFEQVGIIGHTEYSRGILNLSQARLVESEISPNPAYAGEEFTITGRISDEKDGAGVCTVEVNYMRVKTNVETDKNGMFTYTTKADTNGTDGDVSVKVIGSSERVKWVEVPIVFRKYEIAKVTVPKPIFFKDDIPSIYVELKDEQGAPAKPNTVVSFKVFDSDGNEVSGWSGQNTVRADGVFVDNHFWDFTGLGKFGNFTVYYSPGPLADWNPSELKANIELVDEYGVSMYYVGNNPVVKTENEIRYKGHFGINKTPAPNVEVQMEYIKRYSGEPSLRTVRGTTDENGAFEAVFLINDPNYDNVLQPGDYNIEGGVATESGLFVRSGLSVMDSIKASK